MAAGKLASQGSAGEVDERLLVQAAQNDPDRFAELYELHFERVYAFVARRLRVREESEDLTAEVFQKALANLPRYKWRGVPFAAWLFRIASNLIADHSKHALRETELAADELSESIEQEAPLEAVEYQARLFRLVQKLPADQRRVIELRFAEEKSIREIAQILGRTDGAVKQLQFRGLQNLRARLDKQDG
ncbi:MAG TPA: sigma-70 family RNA polymerase sigma factor [Pyrinomonadaceae bacterium]|nr:sigma-70 family RNA polymerase sigma factor [Pyrinomonadaceae bacterium]